MKNIFTLLFVSVLFTNQAISQENEKDSLSNTVKITEVVESPLDTLTRAVAALIDDNTKSKRLKISGYIQPQFQYIDSAGAPSYAGGDFTNGTGKYNNRFMMRRGRFKFTYTYNNILLMVNTDVTEKGLAMRETYAKITDPWLNMFSLTAGLLQVQFGYELTQSSSERETPERARYNQILFPTERDLGAFGSVVFPKSSKLYGLKVDAAYMNGSAGVAPEFDSNKDFTGRAQYTKATKNERLTFSFGASYYNGGYRTGTVKDYRLKTQSNGDTKFEYATDTANYERKAVREYFGADIQASIDWKIGITTIRAEYIQGENPGTSSSNKTPGAVPTSSIYHRQFNGAYFYLIQDIGETKFQAVVKYDWFDPNVKLSGIQIGKTGTNSNLGDIKFETIGFGLTYRINSYAKVMAYYDLVKNENTLVKAYTGDIKDNVFTLRMQFKY